MALFGKKEKTPGPKAEIQQPVIVRERQNAGHSKKHAGAILLSPRVTEKGTILAEQGAYVFNVGKGANKKEIADAVRALFKVIPTHVRILRTPSKKVLSRSGIRGKTASGKKAYVFLKKGEKIEIA